MALPEAVTVGIRLPSNGRFMAIASSDGWAPSPAVVRFRPKIDVRAGLSPPEMVEPEAGDPALALVFSAQAPAFKSARFGPVAQPDRATVS